MSTWNPDLYMKFGGLRTRPAFELASRIAKLTPKKVYDLGCGPGNSTEILKSFWLNADLMGIDNSADMLLKAEREGPKGVTWGNRDLATWVPDDKPDVIFSNATYQWIDNHESVFPKLMEALEVGGTLAIQMPDNFDAQSHVLLRATAKDGPWAGKVAHEIREAPVAAPCAYYDLFAPLAKSVDIWTTEYGQILEGKDPVFEWVSGTALRPFLDILQGNEKEDFIVQYNERLRAAYPKSVDGTTLFPFKRLFMVIEKE